MVIVLMGTQIKGVEKARENLSWQTLASGHCMYNEIKECRQHKFTADFLIRHVTLS